MKLLVIEDEEDVADFLRVGLKEKGFAVDVVGDGKEGLKTALLYDYDLVILDLHLPGMLGREVAQKLRARKPSFPIIVLTVESGELSKVELLALCDDYLCKPFSLAELDARIRAVLRRGLPIEKDYLRVGELEMDVRKFRVARKGKLVELRNKEFVLLEVFMRNPGAVLTRSELLEKVWGVNTDPFTNTVDVHVRRLRKKIDVGFGYPMLRTVRGRGYSLADSRHLSS